MEKKRKREELQNSVDELITNEEIKIKSIKETPKTFSGLIDVLRIYDSHKENKSIRIEAVNYFNSYHRFKFFHYFDKKGYMNFILNIFFDSSFNIFSKIEDIDESNYHSIYFHNKLYLKIIRDKKFKDWFKNLYENDRDKLDKRLFIMSEFFKKKEYYNIDNLLSIAYSDHDYHDGGGGGGGGGEIVETFTQIFKKIVRESLSYADNIIAYDDVILNYNLLSYALVCKQFFRVLSKILNNEYFDWNKPLIHLNNITEFSLIKQPPLFFNYESIRLIPYSSSREYIELLFSRVESFYIESDEYDSTTNCGISRDIKGYGDDEDEDEDEYLYLYQVSIQSSRYLIYPPPMPSLQSITIDHYYGFKRNYKDLFQHILITNFKTLKNLVNDNGCGGGGIKRFSIRFCTDWNGCPTNQNIKFIKNILEFHSNSLEKIRIDGGKTRSICENRLRLLKSSIDNQSKNKIDWKLKSPSDCLGCCDSDSDSDSDSDGDSDS
ncbi:hypothetical protein DDB_G0268388 [Dictyostelium discoideum AX4]|uniref:Uncharacterized protein n=1 Tax=Dictyostelium discoideum TaxID=44689 RepID=Q55FX2_DICDI|nr:hypothetical protein DDB_G0268388 [Dictyostelium discoideum AX4]EAL73647.1 hypothetical protein DDB_G0268388 [Dictyostelium discoideum AX4]|eukprot:XP_647411.1 hypothetical protein DDB_G0268388 [Dictyostelium discoideum AX4]